jgi:hypothetical protein
MFSGGSKKNIKQKSFIDDENSPDYGMPVVGKQGNDSGNASVISGLDNASAVNNSGDDGSVASLEGGGSVVGDLPIITNLTINTQQANAIHYSKQVKSSINDHTMADIKKLSPNRYVLITTSYTVI